MRQIITVLLLFIFSFSKAQDFYHNFSPAYAQIRKWEGNWAFLSHDPGLETYGGITRMFNPKWIGWYKIDKHKRDSGVYYNKKIHEAEIWATDYYLNVWLDEKFYKIRDKRTAIYLFDYRNSGLISIIHIREVLNEMGECIPITITMDEELTACINRVDQRVFLKKIQTKRMHHYINAVKKYPKQIEYLAGWLNRTYDLD